MGYGLATTYKRKPKTRRMSKTELYSREVKNTIKQARKSKDPEIVKMGNTLYGLVKNKKSVSIYYLKKVKKAIADTYKIDLNDKSRTRALKRVDSILQLANIRK